jgi:hypothetical protein
MNQYLRLLKDRDIQIRLAIFAIGFSPIASLSLSTFNLIPLHISGPAIVLPAIITAFILGAVFPRYRPTLVKGFLLGVVAVTIYDVTCRFPFLRNGVWADFIPKIGKYLLNQDHAHWSIGYLWRYIGNGGGMGLAFYSVYPLVRDRFKKPVPTGIVYGLCIFVCLLITVYLSPSGTTYLFNPSMMSATLGLYGHIVYGSVLGYGAKLFPDNSVTASLFPVSAPMVVHEMTAAMEDAS